MEDDMGVEYRRYLLPRDNTFRPSGEDVARLVEAWIANRYAPKSFREAECLAEHAYWCGPYFQVRERERHPLLLGNPKETFIELLRSPEILFEWPISDTKALGLNYPLRAAPDMGEPDCGPYLDLRIEIADDYVERGDEWIELLNTTACSCGEELSYDPGDSNIFYASRIKRVCPSCGAIFRPQDHPAILRDCATGAPYPEMGGAVSRFAIVIDCGKAFEFEVEDTASGKIEIPTRAEPAFVRLCEAALGVTLYEVGDGY
jgi:hypothetical protein